jgi:uncharacterized membrane protein YfcA
LTLISDPWFYVLAIPAVVALGLSKGGFAGAGQMSTPLLALVMPPLEGAAVMLPIMIVQDVNAVWVYRKEWDRRLILLLMPGSIIGVAAAGWLAAYISDAAVRLLIGGATIFYVLYVWFAASAIVPKERKAGIAGSLFWGSLSGFASCICQAGGPPYQLYAMRLNMPKMVFVSTAAIYFAALNVMKVVPYLALGQFSTAGFATSIVLLPFALAMNQLGFWLVRVTPQDLFYRILTILLFVISCALLYAGIVDFLRR